MGVLRYPWLILTGLWVFYIPNNWVVKRVWNWLKSFVVEDEVQKLQRELKEAKTYEEWLESANDLDTILPANYSWKHSITSKYYHYRLIQERLLSIHAAVMAGEVGELERLLQFGLVRNLGNITDPRLFNRLYAGTKRLIEAYVESVVELIEMMFSSAEYAKVLGTQKRWDMTERAQTAYGKSALVLQGGSIFGLYHIGVMKALHKRGLLPRLILGTSTGAIFAALVAIHTDDELSYFLSGEGINLDAFTERSSRNTEPKPEWFDILFTRLKRYYNSGYVLDREALEQCVETNVGDTTFREAYERTGRVISIAISGDSPGTPNCLNYITTPEVLIRTAAMASNESDPDVAPALIREKGEHGTIQAWSLNDESPAYRERRRKLERRTPPRTDRKTPLHRISELFNVNHFIISQARPYLVPFLATSLHRSSSPSLSLARWWSWSAAQGRLIRAIGTELEHRMNQVDRAFGLPRRVRRFLIDEKVPGPSITLVPEIERSDFVRLLRNPSKGEIDHWIELGEKSVWPCVSALEVRCNIEFTIEKQYEAVRRRPSRQNAPAQTGELGGGSKRSARVRSGSAESNPL